jgi:hypothetical protein
MELHFIFHQELLCGEPLKSENTTTVLVLDLNITQSRGLNNLHYPFFLCESQAGYENVFTVHKSNG